MRVSAVRRQAITEMIVTAAFLRSAVWKPGFSISQPVFRIRCRSTMRHRRAYRSRIRRAPSAFPTGSVVSNTPFEGRRAGRRRGLEGVHRRQPDGSGAEAPALLPGHGNGGFQPAQFDGGAPRLVPGEGLLAACAAPRRGPVNADLVP